MENHWREYFTFTKKERTGIIVLLLLIAIISALPWSFNDVHKNNNTSLDEYERKLANALTTPGYIDSSRGKRYKEEDGGIYFEPKKVTTGSLFNFDPNTLDAAGWKKLGIRDKTIHTIQNYLAKGGRFRKPADVSTIYGMRKEDFERLEPYMQIAETVKPAQFWVTPTREPGFKKPLPESIDVNTADTSAFITLPGIGSKLALRITSFREKLGGFYTVEQVGETYGLADSVFQRIKSYLNCANPVTRTININTADAATLKLHPYIKWNIANAIVQYRQQHGQFSSVEELRQIVAITPEIFQKIVLYLSVK